MNDTPQLPFGPTGFDDDYDPDKYGHLPYPGDPSIGHAIGRDHPETSVEAERLSRGKQARQRSYALRYLYACQVRGCTVAQCVDPMPDLYPSRNEGAIPFQWLRRTGWAKRVLLTDSRFHYHDERPKGKHIARAVGEQTFGVVHVMTDEGIREFECRYLDSQVGA